MTRLFRIIEIIAIAALCLLVSFAAATLAWLLMALIYSSTNGESLMDTVLFFFTLVGCVGLSLVLGRGIERSRHGK